MPICPSLSLIALNSSNVMSSTFRAMLGSFSINACFRVAVHFLIAVPELIHLTLEVNHYMCALFNTKGSNTNGSNTNGPPPQQSDCGTPYIKTQFHQAQWKPSQLTTVQDTK